MLEGADSASSLQRLRCGRDFRDVLVTKYVSLSLQHISLSIGALGDVLGSTLSLSLSLSRSLSMSRSMSSDVL